MGISRSALYARALEEYLALHEPLRVCEQLDRLYGDAASNMDPQIVDAQTTVIGRKKW